MAEFTRMPASEREAALLSWRNSLTAYGKEHFSKPIEFAYLVKSVEKTWQQEEDIASLSSYFSIERYPKRVLFACERSQGAVGYKYWLYPDLGTAIRAVLSRREEQRNFYTIAEKREFYPGRREPAMFFFADLEIEDRFRVEALHGSSFERLVKLSMAAIFGLLESFFLVDLWLWHRSEIAVFRSASATKMSAHVHAPVPFHDVNDFHQLMRHTIEPVFIELVTKLGGEAARRLCYRNTEKDQDAYFFDFNALTPDRVLRLPYNTKIGKKAPLKPNPIAGLTDGWQARRDAAEFMCDAMILCKNSPMFWNERSCIQEGVFRTLPVHRNVAETFVLMMSTVALEKQLAEPSTTVADVFNGALRSAFRHYFHMENVEFQLPPQLLEAAAAASARGIAYVTSLFGFFHPPHHTLLPEFVSYAINFLQLLKQQSLYIALADVFIHRISNHHGGDDGEMRSEIASAMQREVPSREQDVEPLQWIAFAAGHLVQIARMDAADSLSPETGFLQPRIQSIVSRGVALWRFAAVAFHNYDSLPHSMPSFFADTKEWTGLV